MANERSPSNWSASSPRTSRTVTLPFRNGGVCGSAKQNTPSTIDPAAARRIGIAVASSRSVPMHRPATIQPMVPSTRIGGNSRSGSVIWWNEMELLSASVGM